MVFIQVSKLSEQQKQEVYKLWNSEYPKNLQHQSITAFDTYLNNLTAQSHILIVSEKQQIIAWYFDFMREDERWFAIIIDSKSQGSGIGTKILDFAKKRTDELAGWVIDHNNDKMHNGETYASPLGFYLKNGFKLIPSTRLELEKISAVKIKWHK